MYEIDWITSVKPTVDREKFIEQNCLLSSFSHPNCRLLVINSVAEQDNLKWVKEFAELQLVESKRPTLYDLLIASHTEITILSNADVKIYSKKPLQNIIDKSATLMVCRRHDVEFSGEEIVSNYLEAEKLVNLFGYLQSRFTIDFFVISRNFRNHLLNKDWVRKFCLGQAGIDMAILHEAFSFGLVKRLDRKMYLLHLNHESFKIAMPANIIVDPFENIRFSSKRSTAFSGNISSMIFADLPRFCVKVRSIRKAVIRIDMMTVKMRNWFQFSWSNLNFSRARKILKSGREVRLVFWGKLWFFGEADDLDDAIELNSIAIRHALYLQYLKLLKGTDRQ